jgi:hypothetical protein
MSMKAFRLVDQRYDPVEVGRYLTRISDFSNKKLGRGMYFALTREDALQFAKKDHGHEYTHLLTCKLVNVTEDDFADLIANPNLLATLKVRPNSPLFGLTGTDLKVKYCEVHGKKGIIWQATNGWSELCLLPTFVNDAVVIEASEAL